MSVTSKNPFSSPPMQGATTVSPGEAAAPAALQAAPTNLSPQMAPADAQQAQLPTSVPAAAPVSSAPVPVSNNGTPVNPFANAAPPPAVAAGPGAVPPSPFGAPGAEDSFSFDLTNVNSSNLIADGFYLAYLSDIVKGTSRKGNPMWTWDFTIIADGNGAPTNYSGKVSKLFTALTDEALFKLAETAESLALGGSGAPMNFTKQDALYRLALIEIKIQDFEGRKNSSLQRVYPYNGPGGAGTKYNAAQALSAPPVAALPQG